MKKYHVYFFVAQCPTIPYTCGVRADTKAKAKYQAFLKWKEQDKDADFKEFIQTAKAIEWKF
jgi:hypothetical protein